MPSLGKLRGEFRRAFTEPEATAPHRPHLKRPVDNIDEADLVNHASRAVPAQLDHDSQATRRQAHDRRRRYRGEGAQRDKTSRHVGRSVRVQGRRSPVMASVQRGKKLDDLRAPKFTYDNPIRTHSQCLPNKLAQADLASSLDVDSAGNQTDDVRVRYLKFRGILDEHQSFPVRGERQQTREQGRLSGPGSARDDERESGRNDRAKQCRNLDRHGSTSHHQRKHNDSSPRSLPGYQ